jgi:stage II sporulation protein AA (anti-sigma F factor antagonist)
MNKNMIKEKGRGGYESEFSGGLLVARVLGEIDHHSAAEIRKGIDFEIYEHVPQKLILDMSAVDFMDSSGLGLILGRYAKMKEIGGELVVLNPGENVLKIIKLAGAERIVKIEMIDVEEELKKQQEKKTVSKERRGASDRSFR